MRTEFLKSQNFTKQVTDALKTENQNSPTLQEELHTRTAAYALTLKLKKPEQFKRKGKITSWVVYIDKYMRKTPSDQAFLMAVSFLEGSAHEMWILYSFTEDIRNIKTL